MTDFEKLFFALAGAVAYSAFQWYVFRKLDARFPAMAHKRVTAASS